MTSDKCVKQPVRPCCALYKIEETHKYTNGPTGGSLPRYRIARLPKSTPVPEFLPGSIAKCGCRLPMDRRRTDRGLRTWVQQDHRADDTRSLDVEVLTLAVYHVDPLGIRLVAVGIIGGLINWRPITRPSQQWFGKRWPNRIAMPSVATTASPFKTTSPENSRDI